MPDASFLTTTASAFKVLSLSVLSGLGFSASAVVVRHENYLTSTEIAFYAFAGTFCCSLPLALRRTWQLLGPRGLRLPLLGRAILSVLNTFFLMACFKFLPTAKSTVIVNSVPAFSFLFARIFLKEPMARVHLAAAAVGFAGVVLSVDVRRLLDGHVDSVTYTGIGCGLASVFFESLMIVATRRLKDVHYAVVNVSTSLLGLLVFGSVSFAMADYSAPHCGYRRIASVCIGNSNFFGQILHVMALQAGNVGTVTIVRCSVEILMGVFWQVTVFKERLCDLCILGTVLTIVAVALVGFRSWLSAQPETNSVRVKFRFMIT